MTWVDAVQRYSRLVLSVPRRYGLRGQDAEDVLQSAWATAFEKRDEPPPEDEFVPWIVSIAFWTTRGFLRDAGRMPALIPGIEHIEPTGSDDLLHLIERTEQEQIVREALTTLPARDRQLLEELFLAPTPMTYAELAARLGIASGSIGALRGRALSRLERELRRRGLS